MTWILKKVNRIPTRCGVAYMRVSAGLLDVTLLECGVPLSSFSNTSGLSTVGFKGAHLV